LESIPIWTLTNLKPKLLGSLTFSAIIDLAVHQT